MDEIEITKLRETMEAATLPIILWWPMSGTIRRVVAVSSEKYDPDKTGTSDFIARFLGGGHVDLTNAESGDFFIAKPMFD